jgi:hypothetical protein
MRLKTLEGLFVRAPARTLMGYNWVQPDTIGLIPVAALTCGILLAAAWRFSPETGQRGWLAFGFVWVILAALPIHPLLFIDASVMNGRTLHLGSIGLVLFIAQILQGGTRGFHWGLTAFLAVLLGLGTVHNLGAWRWTSQLTRQTLSEVQALEPAPEPGTHFVFHDLPDSERGVFFLRTVSESLQIIYQRQDVSGQRRENGPVSGNHVIHLRWKGNQPPILERIPE